MLLYGKNLKKKHNETLLFEDADVYLEARTKIGLIGANGSGKSTLLRLLSGKEEVDEGVVWKAPDAKIVYLEQNALYKEDNTILMQVLDSLADKDKIEKEHEAKALLTKFGFLDVHKWMHQCSGGEKRRVALAAALVQPSNVLLLDEPTNHLDSDIIEWLEEYLKKIYWSNFNGNTRSIFFRTGYHAYS